MQKIYLVRHGQASFGQDHYDQLSENGALQAELLAQAWREQNFCTERFCSGSLSRQKQTANIIKKTLNIESPLSEFTEFNEFPAEAITEHYLPIIVQQKNDPRLTRETIFSDNFLFQKLFAEVIKSWIGETNSKDLHFESWSDFSKRINQALETLKQIEFEKSLVVFTSAGVIAACSYLLMNQSHTLDFQMFKTAWNIINSSVTELHLNNGQLFLHGLNQYSHLYQTPELITYR